MANSDTEVCWTKPGLRKGSQRQRRRWAWEEAGKVTDGSGLSSWEVEGPLPTAASPELLDDFRHAQQCLQPLEWTPDLQPRAASDSEPGESTGEEVEAEDVDSLEGSTVPLHWLPQQDPHLDTPEEELDMPPETVEVEEMGDNSPTLGFEAGLSSEEENNENSSRTLEWGQERNWLGPGQQNKRDMPLEHSEAHPTVDLSPTRSWSSGTMSLGPPSDSLGSPWEGEAPGPRPPVLTRSYSQHAGHHLLNQVDSIGGSVTVATTQEFQDSPTPRTPSPQDPEDRWETQVTGVSCPQRGTQAWKRTWLSPKTLPSRFTGSISTPQSVSRPSPRQRGTLAGHATSKDVRKYGRGQLNHPLPDLSKVGPRVKFPKDECYQPPKARQPRTPARPPIFKSPAEIVREVLLSNRDASPGENPPPIARVPQEFQTPEQATKLVHQLQEDYHKLLTKYAEAENTIDQLRLGAKVNLYSDPPKPSHSIHMGTVSQGTKVLSFTIPKPQYSERWPSPSVFPQVSEAEGGLITGGDLSLSSSTSAPTPEGLPGQQSLTKDQPSAEQTQILASQARRFLARVESFVGLMQAGCLTPQDQHKGFQRLKAAHAALEEKYLQACREQRQTPQFGGPKDTPGTFDPGRELEAEIFQLGIRLEELKDHLEQNQQAPEPLDLASPFLDSSPRTPHHHQPTQPPSPTGQTPRPSMQALCTELDATSTGPHQPHPRRETRVVCSKEDEEEDQSLGIPAPFRHKERQAEQDFQGLLERYLSAKSLPEGLRTEDEEDEVEQEEDEEQEDEEGHSSVLGTMEPRRLHSVQTGRSHRATRENMEQMASVNRPAFRAPSARDRHPSGLGKAEAAAPGPGRPPHPRNSKAGGSHESSLTSLEGSGSPEQLVQKSPGQAGRPHREEPWMASPETDSGFVGSETSRASPLTQTPEHRLAHISASLPSGSPSTPRIMRKTTTEPAAWVGGSHTQTTTPQVLRKASEPSLGKNRAQSHLSAQKTPLRDRPRSFYPGRASSVETVPGSEFEEGHKEVSEQLPRSVTMSPVPMPAPTAVACGPEETTSSFLLTRAGRDKAIQELQEEVSQLRVRLEDSLHRSPQSSPTHPPSTLECPTRVRDRRADALPIRGTHYGSKSTERLSGEPTDAEPAVPTERRPTRSSSVPRKMPQKTLSSESEPNSPHLLSKKSKSLNKDRQWASSDDETRGVGSARRSDRVTFRGQYTGQQYHVLTPKTALKGSSRPPCLHCQPPASQDTGSFVAKDSGGLSTRDTPQCPRCCRLGISPEAASSVLPPSGPEKAATRKNPAAAANPKQKGQRAVSPGRPVPGLWYLAGPPLAYVSSVPVLPYPSATVYYAPPGSTSARLAAEWPPTASSSSRRVPPRHSIQLDLEDLEELNQALSRAAEAAESVRSTARQMTRSLSAELHQARGLRGSCLF